MRHWRWIAVLMLATGLASCGTPTPTTAIGTTAPAASTQTAATSMAEATATSAAAPSAVGAPEVRQVSVRFQWLAQYQFAGYIVAKVKGYYSDAGLDVTLNPGGPDAPSLKLVAGGADTFGAIGPDTIFLSQEKGIKVISLATWFQDSPVAFMVHSDSNINGPKDFPGKTVAMFYGDNVETEYRAMLAAAGVDRKQIKEIPGDVNLEPFLSKRVDVWPVYATDEPDLARKQGASIRLIYARDSGARLMGDTLFSTSDFVSKNPNTVQNFVSATIRGWEYAANHLDETVQLIAAYNKQLDVSHLHYEGSETIKLLRAGVGTTCIGLNDPQAWSAEQKTLTDLGLLKSNVPLESAFTNDFVHAYYQHNGISCPA